MLGGLGRWPERSPNTSSIEYLLWGHLKINILRDIVARLSIAAPNTGKIVGIFVIFRQLRLRRYQACITDGDHNFEHLLHLLLQLLLQIKNSFFFHVLFFVFVPQYITSDQTFPYKYDCFSQLHRSSKFIP